MFVMLRYSDVICDFETCFLRNSDLFVLACDLPLHSPVVRTASSPLVKLQRVFCVYGEVRSSFIQR